MKSIFLAATICLLAFTGCKKETTDVNKMHGAWIRKGTDGSGPAGTLLFAKVNGVNTISFNSGGSPGPGWPASASTEYNFSQGKLRYKNYYDPSQGFYTIQSFKWIIEGEEFEINQNELLLFMSAIYPVRYVKQP